MHTKYRHAFPVFVMKQNFTSAAKADVEQEASAQSGTKNKQKKHPKQSDTKVQGQMHRCSICHQLPNVGFLKKISN